MNTNQKNTNQKNYMFVNQLVDEQVVKKWFSSETTLLLILTFTVNRTYEWGYNFNF